MLKINRSSIGTIAEAAFASMARLFNFLPLSWRGVSALILGVLLAKWFWILFAPQTSFTAALPQRAAGMETGQLFGVTSSNETTANGVALPNVQLLGVFAASEGKRGFAVLKLDDRSQTGVAEGEEVATGTRLVAVHADHVVLERAGVRQRVNLENKYASSPHGITLQGMNKAPANSK
jgi:general secretion pathway protein C